MRDPSFVIFACTIGIERLLSVRRQRDDKHIAGFIIVEFFQVCLLYTSRLTWSAAFQSGAAGKGPAVPVRTGNWPAPELPVSAEPVQPKQAAPGHSRHNIPAGANVPETGRLFPDDK